MPFHDLGYPRRKPSERPLPRHSPQNYFFIHDKTNPTKTNLNTLIYNTFPTQKLIFKTTKNGEHPFHRALLD